jgi:hypothetical protein
MEALVQLQQHTITSLIQAIEYAEKNKLTNTQEFINFLDKINMLSVSY